MSAPLVRHDDSPADPAEDSYLVKIPLTGLIPLHATGARVQVASHRDATRDLLSNDPLLSNSQHPRLRSTAAVVGLFAEQSSSPFL